MCDVKRFLNAVKSMTDPFLFAMFTDEIWFENWPLSEERKKEFCEKESLLLEARVFNKEKEIKLFRTDIGKVFRMRERDDSKEYFEEEQYLVSDEKIVLHNYIDYYEETGQAYVSDWRLVVKKDENLSGYL